MHPSDLRGHHRLLLKLSTLLRRGPAAVAASSALVGAALLLLQAGGGGGAGTGPSTLTLMRTGSPTEDDLAAAALGALAAATGLSADQIKKTLSISHDPTTGATTVAGAAWAEGPISVSAGGCTGEVLLSSSAFHNLDGGAFEETLQNQALEKCAGRQPSPSPKQRPSRPQADVDATYVLGNTKGVRAYPYATSLTTNPGDLASSANQKAHTVGEVWCSMLYEVLGNMVDQAGFMPVTDLTHPDVAGVREDE
ncbi:hypothetical protein DFJ73DRAFT_897440 [Zopfochytrium polystomum]|nr:hypothetical protein DFJ73DRAFT_897440 [Zopfochytrium polystomum]